MSSIIRKKKLNLEIKNYYSQLGRGRTQIIRTELTFITDRMEFVGQLISRQVFRKKSVCPCSSITFNHQYIWRLGDGMKGIRPFPMQCGED